jgi:hypothetical protein
LERDRGAVLLVEAAAEGLINFREARLLDKTWWRRVRIMTDVLSRRTRAKVADASLRYHLALVANSGLKPGSFEKAQDTAKERFYDLLGCWRPWEGASYAERQAKEFADYRQAYVDAFGCDPYDPAFKTWEAEQIRKLQEEQKEDSDAEAERKLAAAMQEHVKRNTGHGRRRVKPNLSAVRSARQRRAV